MPERVQVTAAGRLHMGFLDLGAGPGRRFGSIGLALDAPLTRLAVSRARQTEVVGPERERAAQALATAARALALPGEHRLEVAGAIPPHAGLGSGTQLALGVAAALRRLHGMPADTMADAQALGRGARSGIGVALFSQGGFVVDGGRGGSGGLPPLLARLPVPEAWRILLVLDPQENGLSGGAERAAFAALPPMPDAVSGEICRQVLLGVLPGLAEADLAAFGAAVASIQARLGDHFAPAQGGRFSSPRVAAALARLAALGAVGVGQSSWGPTGFAFAATEDDADRLAAALAPAEGLDIRVARALNRGAAVVAD